MSKLIVSEPWDFRGAGGSNELPGCVIKRLDLKTLLFRADDEVSMKGISGKFWLISSRFVEQSFDQEPYAGTVNGFLLKRPPSDGDDLSEIKQNAVFAVIGSLHE